MFPIHFIFILCLMLAGAAELAAQEWGAPSQAAKIQFGPLGLTPALGLASGIDDNVFNDTVDPQSDFTTDISGVLQAWLGAGRSRVIASAQADYLYFNRYADQRALGSAAAGRFEVTLHRIRPFVSGAFTNVRARPSLEIDTRARRRERTVGGGLEIRLTDKLQLAGSAERARYTIANDEFFQQRNLSSALNRTTDRGDVAVRYLFSPMTRFSLTVNTEADRFDSQPSAVARRLQIRPAVDFSPLALVQGHAEVAYLNFRPGIAQVDTFSGIVASVQLNYVLLGRTRFAARVSREPVYSALATSAYYVQTGFGGSITQVITEQVDVRGSWDRSRLAYSALRTDIEQIGPVVRGGESVVYTYGGSVGYRFGQNTRLALNGDFNSRVSRSLQGDFQGFRLYSAITYGS